MTSAELGPGDLVAGKYVVERALGRGGMGQVFAARHVELGTTVAVKAVLRNALDGPEGVARFKREALAMAQLQSEHAVRVLDVGETEAGTAYIIMEYLEGNDLWQELQRRGPLPPEEACAYVLQACDALAEAHHLGIVHRDLKPGNLFLARRKSGQRIVRVLDFGVAKALDNSAFRTAHAGKAGFDATTQGVMLGTPNFMAPEQVRGAADAIGPHTDVYGAGATLYTLLTGDYPFKSPNPIVVCKEVLERPPVPPSQRRSGIPPLVEEIVLRCLEKIPAKRYASIDELARALAKAVRGTSADIQGDALAIFLPLPPKIDDAETEVTGPPSGLGAESGSGVIPSVKPSAAELPTFQGDGQTTAAALPTVLQRPSFERTLPMATPAPRLPSVMVQGTASVPPGAPPRAHAPARHTTVRTARRSTAIVALALVWLAAAGVAAGVLLTTRERAEVATAAGTATAARSLARAAKVAPQAPSPAPAP